MALVHGNEIAIEPWWRRSTLRTRKDNSVNVVKLTRNLQIDKKQVSKFETENATTI